MTESKNKRLIILYVYKLLMEGSSKEKPIKQCSILRILNSLGFSCNRKTIASYINIIKKFGEKTKSYTLVRVERGFYITKEK